MPSLSCSSRGFCLLKKIICICFFLGIASCGVCQDSYLFSRDGTGRLHQFEQEQAAVLSKEGATTTAMSDGNTFSRSSYDDDMRLVSKVVWKQNDEGIPFITETVYFSYEGSSSFPYESSKYNLVEETLVRTDFTVSGKVKSERFYSIGSEDGQMLVSETFYSYDKDSMLTEKTTKTYDGSALRSTERIVLHVPGEERAGHEYYKDGVLQRSLEFTGENDYVETLYFPGGHSVRTVYLAGRLVEEVFSVDGKVLGRNEY